MRSIVLLLVLLIPGFASAFPNPFFTSFHTMLSVPQEVKRTQPTTPNNAVGFAKFIYNPWTKTLSYDINFLHLSSAPTMSHFHFGPSGSNGPVLQTICGSPAPALIGSCPASNSGTLQGLWHLSDTQVQELYQGEIYINIHTKLNPGGEIRGQLVPLF